MRIRRAVPSDAERLATFASQQFEETYSAFNDPRDMQSYVAKNFSPARLREELASDTVQALIAAEDRGWAGYAYLRKRAPPTKIAASAAVELARLYVDADWHGRGVAARLLAACADAALDWQGDALWLSVWTENDRAIRFYVKHGFDFAGVLSFRLGGDLQEDHLMIRRLTPAGR